MGRSYLRYRRRRRLRRLRRPIMGSSIVRGVKACFNVESQIRFTYNIGAKFPVSPYVILPWWGKLIPQDYINNGYLETSNGKWMVSLFNSETFRKMLTIYSEMKIDGVYVSVTPTDFGGARENTYTIYNAWDRKGKNRSVGGFFGDAINEAESERIKASSNEQGTRFSMLGADKGGWTHRSKCLPLSSGERYTYIDTRTIHDEVTVSATEEAHYFAVDAADTSGPISYFSPLYYLTMERTNLTMAAEEVSCILRMRFYCSFRAPGTCSSTTTVQRLLLQSNDQLKPFEASKAASPLTAPTPILSSTTNL